MKLSQLKISQIKKLDKAYYVKFPLKFCASENSKGKASILELDNENIVWGCSHFMLYDDERIFTTLEEAQNYCNNYGYEYIINNNFRLKD